MDPRVGLCVDLREGLRVRVDLEWVGEWTCEWVCERTCEWTCKWTCEWVCE